MNIGVMKSMAIHLLRITMDIPRDRNASFDPMIIGKHTRDISESIKDIYGIDDKQDYR
jgi:hypothetical protein